MIYPVQTGDTRRGEADFHYRPASSPDVSFLSSSDIHRWEKAADIYIPKPRNGHQKSKEISNWKEKIQPFRDKAQFWDAV